MRAVLLAALLSGCGSMVPDTGTELVCRAVVCPAHADVEEAVFTFREYAELGDASVTVEWHAVGEVFAEWTDAGGNLNRAGALTVSPDRVQVTSWAYLAHELMHVSHWRVDGDPDGNHEVKGGPWTGGDNIVVGEVAAAFELTYP